MPHWKVKDEATQATVAELPTLKTAEAWIAEREEIEPEKVHAGGYGIDGPCPNSGETITSEGGDILVGLETPRMLVLSTAHITYKTSQALANGLGCIPAGVARRDYGWIIPIYKQWDDHEDGDDPIPADLIAIRDFAVANGCTWICLDQDGDILTALPSYDW